MVPGFLGLMIAIPKVFLKVIEIMLG